MSGPRAPSSLLVLNPLDIPPPPFDSLILLILPSTHGCSKAAVFRLSPAQSCREWLYFSGGLYTHLIGFFFPLVLYPVPEQSHIFPELHVLLILSGELVTGRPGLASSLACTVLLFYTQVSCQCLKMETK